MTQQVYRGRVTLTSLSPFIDNPGFDFYVEQTGSNTALTNATAATLVTNFFTATAAGATRAMGAYMHSVCSRAANACSLQFYDITAHLNGSPAGSPVYATSFTLPAHAGAGVGLPEGCCLLIGYHATYGTDVEFGPGTRPRMRDRGRIYLGPIDGGWTVADANSRTTWVTASIVTDARAAFNAATVYGGGADVPALVQWSRKNATVKQITTMYVEDAPRYQRRRSDLGAKV